MNRSCVKLQPGHYLVFTNGTLTEVDPEDPKIFSCRDMAVEYINDQLESYPGLDYYLCLVTELHHCSVDNHVINLGEHA